MTVQEKTRRFLCALSDVYRDEEDRKLATFSAIELSDDVTDDFTAMLLAMNRLFHWITDDDGDLINFTHILNKLAIQHIMHKKDVSNDCEN